MRHIQRVFQNGKITKITGVTAVTDRSSDIRETSIVNMVQRASKKVLLEPGDTRQQWKGEAATSFVN
jgi:hypothetical protein